jgi:hypothetical protein
MMGKTLPPLASNDLFGDIVPLDFKLPKDSFG